MNLFGCCRHLVALSSRKSELPLHTHMRHTHKQLWKQSVVLAGWVIYVGMRESFGCLIRA